MEDSSFLPDYSNADVISFSSRIQKVGKFRSALKNVFTNTSVLDVLNKALQCHLGILSLEWFNKGVNCEVLRVGGSSWQKGKLRIRITVEFCPDEPTFEQTMASHQSEINQPELRFDDFRRLIN